MTNFTNLPELRKIDGYVGLGYALSQAEELELVCEVARTEGIFLDPVYPGKAFFGLIQELKRDPKCFGEQIIFLHSGGLFGLFSKAAKSGRCFKPGSQTTVNRLNIQHRTSNIVGATLNRF